MIIIRFITFLAIAVIGPASSLRAEAQSIEFDARVVEIKSTRQFNAGTIITGVDPRFVVRLVLVTDVEGVGKSGQTVSFAIHSPSRDLLITDQEAAVGQQVRLRLSGSTDPIKLLRRARSNKEAQVQE